MRYPIQSLKGHIIGPSFPDSPLPKSKFRVLTQKAQDLKFRQEVHATVVGVGIDGSSTITTTTTLPHLRA